MKFYIFFFLISFTTYSQNATLSSIREKGDSLIRSKVGDKLSKHFELYKKMSYMHISTSTKNETLFFEKENTTEGKFIAAYITYTFEYPKIKGLKHRFFIYIDKDYNFFDKNHHPIDEQSFNFIPSFLIKNEPSNFILPTKAKIIATKLIEKKGIKITEPELAYNDEHKEYRYQIKNIFEEKKDKNGEITFTSYDQIELNAVTGNLVNKSSIIESSNALTNKIE